MKVIVEKRNKGGNLKSNYKKKLVAKDYVKDFIRNSLNIFINKLDKEFLYGKDTHIHTIQIVLLSDKNETVITLQ